MSEPAGAQPQLADTASAQNDEAAVPKNKATPRRRRPRRLQHSTSAPADVCNCVSPGEAGTATSGAPCSAADAGAESASANVKRDAEASERGAGNAGAGEHAGQKHPARSKARAARAAARGAAAGGSAESSASDLEVGRCDAGRKGAKPQKQKAQARGKQAPQGAASAPGAAAPAGAEAPRRLSQEAAGAVNGAEKGGATGRSSADNGRGASGARVWAGPGFCVPPAPERLPQPTASLLARR